MAKRKAQTSGGPLTVTGDLVVTGSSGPVFTVKANPANPAIAVNGVNSNFLNLRTFGSIDCGGPLSCFGVLTCGALKPNTRNNVIGLTGGLEISGGLIVGHDLSVDGDILLGGADCAEDFDVGTQTLVDPGTVMVLGEEGALFPCLKAYDKRVVGVVSGAGDFKPSLILDKRKTDRKRQPLALVGKTYCKVDASTSAIEIGDLLTSSSTLGHAMKAEECQTAFGAIIGKALSPLRSGLGLIPILVALQ
jgi:hypothetical protein